MEKTDAFENPTISISQALHAAPRELADGQNLFRLTMCQRDGKQIDAFDTADGWMRTLRYFAEFMGGHPSHDREGTNPILCALNGDPAMIIEPGKDSEGRSYLVPRTEVKT